MKMPERLTQERPTGPYRADCGHLCNCFLFTHDGQQWYEHDIYATYENNEESGTECGVCYRARMEALPDIDIVAAFSGDILNI